MKRIIIGLFLIISVASFGQRFDDLTLVDTANGLDQMYIKKKGVTNVRRIELSHIKNYVLKNAGFDTTAIGVDSLSKLFWNINGNSGTNHTTNFLGTTDGEPFRITSDSTYISYLNSSVNLSHINGMLKIPIFGLDIACSCDVNKDSISGDIAISGTADLSALGFSTEAAVLFHIDGSNGNNSTVLVDNSGGLPMVITKVNVPATGKTMLSRLDPYSYKIIKGDGSDTTFIVTEKTISAKLAQCGLLIGAAPAWGIDSNLIGLASVSRDTLQDAGLSAIYGVYAKIHFTDNQKNQSLATYDQEYKETPDSMSINYRYSLGLDSSIIFKFDKDSGIVAKFNGVPLFSISKQGKLKIVDGMQANGYVLTSDANGLASWGKITASTKFDLSALPQYANNAAALSGGLLAGQIYVDNSWHLVVVH